MARFPLRMGLVLFLLAGSLAPALPAAAAIPASAAARPREPDAGKLSPEVRPIFERSRAALAAAGTARGKVSTTWRVKFDEAAEEDRSESSIEFAIAAPDRLHLVKEGIHIFANAQTLTVYRPDWKQYIQVPAPRPDKLESQIEELTESQINSIPYRSLLQPGLSLEDMVGSGREMKTLREGEWEGRKGTWVTGEGVQQEAELGVPKYQIETFFDSATGFARYSRFDMTAQEAARIREQNEMGEGEEDFEAAPIPISAIWEVDFSKIEHGVQIPPETFEFKPSASDKKVDEFAYEAPETPPQESLLGLAAPAFEGSNFDGQKVALADFKGKVLVLDFWATWCGPCVAALPHMQKLHEEFSGQNVAFLGMNHDQPNSGSKVKKFLEKKKVTIPQFDDSSNAAGVAYGVTGIPCVVLIDTQGVMQSVRVGFSPDAEESLGAEIRQLLAGKPLKTDEEFKAVRDKAASGEDSGPHRSFRSKPLKLADIRAAALTDAGRSAANAAPFRGGFMSAAAIDVSGDNRQSVVLQGMNGGLVIVSPDGLSSKRLKLEGVRGGPMSIVEAKVVKVDGELRWLIGSGAYQAGGAISMHDANGKKIWSFTPELAKANMSNCNLEYGDVDGDDKPEIVVFVSAFSSSGDGQDMSSGAVLLVLDAQTGQLLSQKSLGEHSSYMCLASEPSEGKGRAILLGTYSDLRRYRFDRSKATLAEAP